MAYEDRLTAKFNWNKHAAFKTTLRSRIIAFERGIDVDELLYIGQIESWSDDCETEVLADRINMVGNEFGVDSDQWSGQREVPVEVISSGRPREMIEYYAPPPPGISVGEYITKLTIDVVNDSYFESSQLAVGFRMFIGVPGEVGSLLLDAKGGRIEEKILDTEGYICDIKTAWMVDYGVRFGHP